MIRKPKQIIWGLIILIFLLSPSLLLAELSKINNDWHLKNLTLLLNSGLTHCEISNVKYILWTEDSSELPILEEIIQNSSLIWQKEVISDFAGTKVYKFSSENQINKEGEKLIPKQLDSLEKQLKGTRILLYFYQQIDQTIDIGHYLSSNEVKETQKTKTDKLFSITGYSNTIAKILHSNKFDTNVQIITNNIDNKEKTLLAIPVLLEDF